MADRRPPERREGHEPPEPVAEGAPRGLSRRRALQVLAAGAAGAAALPAAGCTGGTDTSPTGETQVAGPPPDGNPLAAGTGTDPDLISPVVPWEMVLEDGELETVAALCDRFVPEERRSPSGAALGAHRVIDEWVRAPYGGKR
jgi:hypothetical protein